MLRSFILADGAEVKGATLDRGLLSVELACMVARPGARKIAVMPAGGGAPERPASNATVEINARRFGRLPPPADNQPTVTDGDAQFASRKTRYRQRDPQRCIIDLAYVVGG